MAAAVAGRLQHARIERDLQPCTQATQAGFRIQGQLLIPQPKHRFATTAQPAFMAGIDPTPAQQRFQTGQPLAPLPSIPGAGMNPGAQISCEMEDADLQIVILMKGQREISLIGIHHPGGCCL